jgi:BirA family biotin operon repressor/biotin-[acetyl-CoA-carboxylase] ligase
MRRAVSAAIVGHRLCVFGEVTSTNAVLRRMAVEGAAEGTVVIAEAQTHGVGRLGQHWYSPPGVNLYAGALFRPQIALDEVPAFSFLASLALTEAIRMEGLWPAIKWPNDIVVNGRKVAGVRGDCAIVDGTVEWVILGVGVNVNVGHAQLRTALGPAGLAATSLREAAGRPIDRNAFAGAFLTSLDRWYHSFRAEGVEPVLAAWRDRDILTGRRVELPDRNGVIGRVRGVNRMGALLVEDTLGTVHEVVGGEVRVAD